MNWKTGIPMALIAVAMMCPSTVKAGDDGWAALGGFLLGGLLLSDSGHAHHEYRTVRHERVIVEEPVAQGYYTYRTQRVWHPGHHIHRRLACGTLRRVWEPGHYEHRKVKVWVPSHSRSYSSRRGSSCDY